MAEPFDPVPVALRFAADAPEAMLPCPLCAVSVKGDNLARHLEKPHESISKTGRYPGRDRAAFRPLFVLFIVSLLGLPLILVVPSLEQPVLWALIAAQSVFLVGMAMTHFDLLPAELILESDRLSVRFGLGLFRRSVALPPERIEVGSLVDDRPSTLVPGNPYHQYDSVKAGTFMRLCSKGQAIVLGSKRGTRLRKHWREGCWHGSKKTKMWDITLPPSTLVLIEYWLADRGLLVPVT